MNVRLRKIADTDLVYGKLMPLIRVSEMYLIAAECPDFVNVSPKNHLQIMGRYVDVVS